MQSTLWQKNFHTIGLERVMEIFQQQWPTVTCGRQENGKTSVANVFRIGHGCSLHIVDSIECRDQCGMTFFRLRRVRFEETEVGQWSIFI